MGCNDVKIWVKYMSNRMSKRILVTMPDQLEAGLKAEAERQGRSLSNLCSYLLEKSYEELQTEKSEEKK